MKIASKQLKIGSLFAGIGGFDLGFERAGFTTAWCVEIDKPCQQVLRKHFPAAEIFDDVCEVGAHNLSPVDVITFGSPCQDLSVAGKREGLIDGKKSSLFFEAARIIRELKPAFAVWENVPGTFSSDAGRDFAAILSELVQCGARDMCWRVFNARYFGVAQKRRRIILVADFRGNRSGQILFESDSVCRDTSPREKTGQEITGISGEGINGSGVTTGVLTTLFGTRGTHVEAVCNEVCAVVARPLRAKGNSSHREDSDTYIVSPPVTGKWAKGSGGPAGDECQNLVCGSLQAHSKQHGHAMTTQQAAENGQLIAYKIRGGKSGGGKGYIGSELTGFSDQYVGVRRLTPLECERLQGFPDGWTSGQKDSPRYRQLGNAVAPPVAEWVARRIYTAILKAGII